MKTQKLSLLLPILIIISCSNPSQNNTNKLPGIQQNVAEILPLKVGNFWEYDEIEYENDSLITQRNTKTEVIDKINILLEKKILNASGLEWALVLHGIQIFITQKKSVFYKISQKEMTDIIERKF